MEFTKYKLNQKEPQFPEIRFVLILALFYFELT